MVDYAITPRQRTRFYARLKPEGECLVWTGYTDNGYGKFATGRISDGNYGPVRTHRLAWALANPGYIFAPEEFVCHHCDNPPCCKIEHLFVGTPADNHRDMMEKRRGPQGERSWKSTLTDSDVQGIRSSSESLAVLARRYDVRTCTISAVLRHRSWKHAGGPRQGREMVGERHYAAILTEEDVLEIRASDETHAALGARYGVSRSNIGMVKNRKSWKHLPDDDLFALFGG